MTEKFPEYFILKDALPNGTVIDGEIVPFRLNNLSFTSGGLEGVVLPFALLQTRR